MKRGSDGDVMTKLVQKWNAQMKEKVYVWILQSKGCFAEKSSSGKMH